MVQTRLARLVARLIDWYLGSPAALAARERDMQRRIARHAPCQFV